MSEVKQFLKQQMHQLFAKYEVDAGGLTRTNLKQVCMEIDPDLSEFEIDELLDRLARSADDQINSAKFLGYLYKDTNDVNAIALDVQGAIDETDAFDQATLLQVFVTYDQAETGNVSVDTFEQALKEGAHAIVDKLPVLSTLSTMFDQNQNSVMEFSEFCALADALRKGDVPGVPRTCVVKLASQLGEVDAKFDEDGELVLCDDNILKCAFDIFCGGSAEPISYAEVATLIAKAGHSFIEELQIASAMSAMLGNKGQTRFRFDEFRIMASALARGNIPTLPNLDVVTLSPTSKCKPNIMESMLAYGDE